MPEILTPIQAETLAVSQKCLEEVQKVLRLWNCVIDPKVMILGPAIFTDWQVRWLGPKVSLTTKDS